MSTSTAQRQAYIPTVIKGGQRPKTTGKVKAPDIPLTRDEHLSLCIPPNFAMWNIQYNYGTGTDWYDIYTRVYVGLKIAELKYTKSVVDDFKLAVEMLERVQERYRITGDWFMAKDEIAHVSPAVYVVDEMQEEIDRATLLFAYRKARVYLSKYL